MAGCRYDQVISRAAAICGVCHRATGLQLRAVFRALVEEERLVELVPPCTLPRLAPRVLPHFPLRLLELVPPLPCPASLSGAPPPSQHGASLVTKSPLQLIIPLGDQKMGRKPLLQRTATSDVGGPAMHQLAVQLSLPWLLRPGSGSAVTLGSGCI